MDKRDRCGTGRPGRWRVWRVWRVIWPALLAVLIADMASQGARAAAASEPTTATAAATMTAGAGSAPAAPGGPPWRACRLKGVEHEARCGSISRLLDPARADGPRIDIHFALLPALAQKKAADPVFFFAGGPGQSAIDLAGPLSRRYARLSNRRDLVFVDQRGTGRSAPLKCDGDEARAAPRPLAELFDEAAQLQRLKACREALMRLPHGDLRQYTTTLAMADIDAVREALGVAQIDAIGGSYGTRAVLEYLRQFPQRVRRAVIDGVAPPDMVLPAAFSIDNQAALDAVLEACAAAPDCSQRHPDLQARWTRLLASLPRPVDLVHPWSGESERVTLTRAGLLSLVRTPLYEPALAAGLPAALAAAADGRFTPLVGLGSALGGGGMATGMHFSVVCAEDLPRLPTGPAPDAGRDFGDTFAAVYRQVCADWPRGTVPAAFYTVGPAPAPTWVLSGGADPVTPPRHGERVARALGARARHIVVDQAGHGVLAQGCLREAVQRFFDAPDDQALAVEAGCAARVPRPPAFVPPAPVAPAAAAGGRS